MNSVKKELSLGRIFNLNFGFLGIQFGWGLQMANMSAIYEYLGAEPDQIPILWMAAPLTGLIIQPIIGHMSDNTWCFLGRRRPYFLVGAICATAALILMPYCTALWMAAVLLWLMDLSVNVSMEPFRAFVADMLPEKQRTTGYSIQSVLIGIGAVVASALPWLLHNVFGMATGSADGAAIPDVVRYSFHIGAAAYFIAVMWTIFTTKEYPPADLAQFQLKKEKKESFFNELLVSLKEMPATMKELAWVQLFSWMGMFCFFLYFTIAVAHNIFGAQEGTPQYEEAEAWAGICMAMYNAVCFVFSLAIPFLCKKLTRKGTHIACLLIGALSLASMLVIQNKYFLLVQMLGFGMAWASILTLPYAMLAGSLPEDRMGVYMGIFNFFITIPQILVSLEFGWIMHSFLHDDRLLGVVAGGVFFAIAALATLRVKDVGYEETRGLELEAEVRA